MTSGKRGLLVTAVILLLAWAAAGAANDNQFWLGATPSASGTAATLVAVGAWPVAGWFWGRRSGSGFIRPAILFWIAVVAGTPVVFWVWSHTRLTVSGGGWMVVTLMRALAVPLYGLAGTVLPTGEPMKTMLLGAGVSAMTLVAYLAARRLGWRTAQADPPCPIRKTPR